MHICLYSELLWPHGRPITILSFLNESGTNSLSLKQEMIRCSRRVLSRPPTSNLTALPCQHLKICKRKQLTERKKQVIIRSTVYRKESKNPTRHIRVPNENRMKKTAENRKTLKRVIEYQKEEAINEDIYTYPERARNKQIETAWQMQNLKRR